MSEPDPALAAAQRLHRVRDALLAGAVPEPDDVAWMGRALDRYLSGPDHVDLDHAFGVKCEPGRVPWWRRTAERDRDALLRELAGPGPGRVLPRAQALQQQLKRYAATSWPRDRASKSPSTANALLFRIFCLDSDPPTGISRLRDIIR